MIARAGHYEPIAREAYPYILPVGLLSFLFWWLDHPLLSFLFLVLAVGIGLFFRNPHRTPPDAEEDAILAPADGKVIEIVDNASSERLGNSPLKRLSIFMSLFDVHVNRSPITGTVEKITYNDGKFLDARETASSFENAHNSLVLHGKDAAIEVVQVAGMIARRISCWVREGDLLRRGDRFGLVHFGSRLDVYLPQDFTFVVSLEARVVAGVTVIARRGQ
jgi:phosphatidylserine decarboxylase